MDREELRVKINELLANREYDRIEETLLYDIEMLRGDNDLVTIYFLLEIYKKESADDEETILDKTGSVEALLKRYTILKFYLRRIEFGLMIDDMSDFRDFLVSNKVSSQELSMAMQYCVAPEHLDIICEALKNMQQHGRQ